MADSAIGEVTCSAIRRPQALASSSPAAHGLRAAQCVPSASLSGRAIDVYLYSEPPPELVDPNPNAAKRWRLVPSPGGAPVSVVSATLVQGTAPTPGHVRLALAGEPDNARYRLEVAPPASVRFDPLRSWLPVRLKPECADTAGCFEAAEPAASPAPSPVHDYTARDWTSLRRALVEYLLREDPGADLSIADPTITILELFAHVGDLLHYRLDRVATEAYLETARLRTSVKQHARLVDYRLSDGVAARAFVHLSVEQGAGPVDVYPGFVAAERPGSAVAFTIEKPSPTASPGDPALRAETALGEIALYDWGEEKCVLPVGATECVLVRPRPADPLGDDWLQAGDLIAFERVHVVDAAKHAQWARRSTGQPFPPVAGAGSFRPPLPGRPAQVVELVEAEPFEDPLALTLIGSGIRLLRIRWRAEDALAESYPVTIDSSGGVPEVAVARGNVVRAHHGRLVDGPAADTLRPRYPEGVDDSAFEPTEYELVACGVPPANGRRGGPGLALAPDGRPHRLELDVTLPSGLGFSPPVLSSLLEAAPGELACVVDVEEHEPPVLRFTTGAAGLPPPVGTRNRIQARYEVGGGADGNVPPNALTVLERNTKGAGATPEWAVVPGVVARNPVAASGGEAPMPLDVVRRDAPEAFAAVARRAVLAADHAAAAAATAGVERAAAERSWSGSWPVVTTLVDLVGTDPSEVLPGLQEKLDSLRVLGTEVAVLEGRPVGIVLALDVCALPGIDPEQLRAQVRALLRPGTDAHPGLFHRSRLQLGKAFYVSAAVAAMAALPEVDSVDVREARRLDEPAGTLRSVISFATDEVGVLDDDPARPDRGRLDVRVRGGG